MTFAARPNLATASFISGASLLVSDQQVWPASSGAGITFQNTGVISVTGDQSDLGGQTNWYLPTTTGIGANYWIKFVLNAGSPWDSGLVSGQLYRLDNSRLVQWTNNTPPSTITKNANVSFFIYSDAGGTSLVGSGTIFVDVESY